MAAATLEARAELRRLFCELLAPVEGRRLLRAICRERVLVAPAAAAAAAEMWPSLSRGSRASAMIEMERKRSLARPPRRAAGGARRAQGPNNRHAKSSRSLGAASKRAAGKKHASACQAVVKREVQQVPPRSGGRHMSAIRPPDCLNCWISQDTVILAAQRGAEERKNWI